MLLPSEKGEFGEETFREQMKINESGERGSEKRIRRVVERR